jgi:hypothetical protein
MTISFHSFTTIQASQKGLVTIKMTAEDVQQLDDDGQTPPLFPD